MSQGKSIIRAIEAILDEVVFWSESEATMPQKGTGMIDDGMYFDFCSRGNRTILTVGTPNHEGDGPEQDFTSMFIGCPPASDEEWVDRFRLLVYALDTEEMNQFDPDNHTTQEERST